MTKRVAFTYAGGHSKTIPELDDDKTNALLDAQSLQHAAHIIHLNDKQRLVINLRNVCALLITDVTPEAEPEPEPVEPPVEEAPVEPAPVEPEPEAPVEPAPEAPAEPEPAPEHETEVSESDTEDTRTVAELKAALDEKGIEYDSRALKAELLELAKTNGV